MSVNGLTKKQDRFIHEYLIDLNATQAAIRAGYSPKSAKVIANENLTKPYLKSVIDSLLEERKQKTKVTAEMVVDELRKIAFADPRKAFRWGPNGVVLVDSEEMSDSDAAVISEVSQTVTKGGGSIRAKLLDKVKALELLGRHLAMFQDVSKVEMKSYTNMFLAEEREKVINAIENEEDESKGTR